MPEISRFFGIVIAMFKETGGRHNLPHFHVRYQEHKATYGIDPVELLAGSLPKRQQRFVEAWAELHQPELSKDWELLESGVLPNPVNPLQP
jgi:hypothetical protein